MLFDTIVSARTKRGKVPCTCGTKCVLLFCRIAQWDGDQSCASFSFSFITHGRSEFVKNPEVCLLLHYNWSNNIFWNNYPESSWKFAFSRCRPVKLIGSSLWKQILISGLSHWELIIPHFSDVLYVHFYCCLLLGGWQNYGLCKIESYFIMILTSKHALFIISSNCLYLNKWKRKWINCKILYPSGTIKTPVNRSKSFAKWILTSVITFFQSFPNWCPYRWGWAQKVVQKRGVQNLWGGSLVRISYFMILCS